MLFADDANIFVGGSSEEEVQDKLISICCSRVPDTKLTAYQHEKVCIHAFSTWSIIDTRDVPELENMAAAVAKMICNCNVKLSAS